MWMGASQGHPLPGHREEAKAVGWEEVGSRGRAFLLVSLPRQGWGHKSETGDPKPRLGGLWEATRPRHSE